MSARVAEHGKVSPRVPLVSPGRRHLRCKIFVDLHHHGVTAFLGGLLVKLRDKVRVYSDALPLQLLGKGFLQIACYLLRGIELRRRRQLAENGSGLDGLTGNSLHLSIKGKNLCRSVGISGVCSVDQQLLSQGCHILGHHTLLHGIAELLQRALKTIRLYRGYGPRDCCFVCGDLVREIPVHDHVLDVKNHIVRDSLRAHSRGGCLSDGIPLGVRGGHIHRPGGVGAFREKFRLGALESAVRVKALSCCADGTLGANSAAPRLLQNGIQLSDVGVVVLKYSSKLRPGVLRVCLVVAPDQSVEFVVYSI